MLGATAGYLHIRLAAGLVMSALETIQPGSFQPLEVANFSLAYGCGVAGLRTLLSNARGTRDTEAEARKVYEAWHQFHPQVSRQMQQFDSGTTRLIDCSGEIILSLIVRSLMLTLNHESINSEGGVTC